ncbi:MAG: PEP-utilizing enzyme [Nitrososphaerota archaeon]
MIIRPTIAIFVAIQPELDALIKLMEFYNCSHDNIDDEGNILCQIPANGNQARGNQGRFHKIVIVHNVYGSNQTSVNLENINKKYPSIKLFIFAGVAGKCKLKIGDIAIGTKVIGFDWKIVNRDEDIIRGRTPEASKEVLKCASRILTNKNQWNGYLESFLKFAKQSKLKGKFKNIRIRQGPIGASNSFINNKEVRDDLAKREGILAIDMEDYAFADICSNQLHKDYAIIRGISDNANGRAKGKTSYERQREVALITSAFLGFLLSNMNDYERSKIDNRVVDLDSLLSSSDWVEGDTNIGEDLHFSSFYLRHSTKKFAEPDKLPFTYSSLIAIYEDFKEFYFLKTQEVEKVANYAINKMKKDPGWMDSVLKNISEGLNEFENFFSEIENLNLSTLSNKRLLEIYRKHNSIHSNLYKWARIPEVLDRSLSLFSNHLKDYLRKLGNSFLTDSEILELFQIFTTPEEPGILDMLDYEYNNLLIELRTEMNRINSEGRQTPYIMMISSSLKKKILEYYNKIKWNEYHGYFRRELQSFDSFLENMRTAVENSSKELLTIMPPSRKLQTERQKRDELFSLYKIDPTYQYLFKIYPKIQRIKEKRMLVQKKNFYYLDRLLEAISEKVGCSEEQIRSMLPEEVEKALKGNPITDDQKSRVPYAVYIIDGKNETILGGREIADQTLNRLSMKSEKVGNYLLGETVFPGRVKGVARIVGRDTKVTTFYDGDILVSEKANPELVPIMKKAAGIVTEQGGMTSHAATMARFIRVPMMVGVKKATEMIQDGDLIELDADKQRVNIMPKIQRLYTIQDSKIGDALRTFGKVPVSYVGTKAYNLFLLLSKKFDVPRFFLVSLEKIRERVNNSGHVKDIIIEVKKETKLALEYLSGDYFIVRSSFSDEDTSSSPNAGKYQSFKLLTKEAVPVVVAAYLKKILSKKLSGSIIVQEMILGDYSGIVLTRTTNKIDQNHMRIEIVEGGNEPLTDGAVTPYIYEINLNTNEEDTDNVSRLENRNYTNIPQNLIARVKSKASDIEDIFGGIPQEIEWTFKGETIYFLQSRNIAEGETEERSIDNNYGNSFQLRNIMAVYSKFGADSDLVKHHLLAAGLAMLICDNWIEKVDSEIVKIDRKSIITALLLHDLNNIVKRLLYQAVSKDNPHYKIYNILNKNRMFWENLERKFEREYGSYSREVTIRICKELGVEQSVIKILKEKDFEKNEETFKSKNYDVKISAYCDQRIGREGVMTLDNRLDEARKIYEGDKWSSVYKDFEKNKNFAKEIESQIQKHVKISLQKIKTKDVEKYFDELREWCV